MARRGRSGDTIVVQDRRYQQILRQAQRVRRGPSQVKVGHITGQNEERDGTSFSNIDVAIVHEFGTADGRIPERSHVRAPFDANIRRYQRIARRFFEDVLDARNSPAMALAKMGAVILKDQKAAITDGIAPPLKNREGTPLLDTGQLINSKTFQVE